VQIVSPFIEEELPENEKLRQDIQGYARLLYLICHYELGNDDLLRYLCKKMKPYFDKQAENEIHQKEILNCMEELSKKPAYEHKDTFKKYLTVFKSIENDIYSIRSTTYLDFTSWLKSKQRKIPLGEVVKKK